MPNDTFTSGIGAFWTAVDAAAAVAGGVCTISVPAGGGKDIWFSDTGLKVLQPADNIDFSISVKIVGTPAVSEQSHIAGLLVTLASGAAIRCDLYSDSGVLKLFCAQATGTISHNASVTRTNTMWLRLVRVGNVFTPGWSANGVDYTDGGALTVTVDVDNYGFWAGSTDADAYAPQFDDFTDGIEPGVPPGDPSSLTASGLFERVELTWTDNDDDPDETTFRVERSPAGAGTWSEVGTADANATTYTDTTGTYGVSYDYRVKARGDDGDSGYSNTATATANANRTWTCEIFDDEGLTEPSTGMTVDPEEIELDDSEDPPDSASGTIDGPQGTYYRVWTSDDEDLNPTDAFEFTLIDGGDVTPPEPVSFETSVDGTRVTITFSEPVTISSLGFTLAGTSATLSGGIADNGTDSPSLLVNTPILIGEFPTISYAAGDTEDLAGNALAGFNDETVTNNSTTEVPPPGEGMGFAVLFVSDLDEEEEE